MLLLKVSSYVYNRYAHKFINLIVDGICNQYFDWWEVLVLHDYTLGQYNAVLAAYS